jgi:hypothetical protein
VPRRQLLAAPLLLAVACATEPAPPPPVSPPKSSSPAPIQAVPKDFLALRTEYGDRSDFAERCENGRPLRAWYDAANGSDWQTVLDSTAKWLDSCPVDIDAHFVRAVALAETGRSIESDVHVGWFRGLVDSILATGDGRSAESPFVVISVPEEYAVLRAFRLEARGQSLLDGGIDAIAVVDKDGNESTAYFRPDAHWRRMARDLP